MASNEKPYAVVLGMYGANALGVVRSLGKEDIPVAGFHMNGRYPHAKFSKYASEFYQIDGKKEMLDSMVEFGREHLARTGERAVVFTTGDNYVTFCQDNASELKPYFHLPLSKKHDLGELMDKNKILGIAESYGFNVPRNMPLTHVDSLTIEEFQGSPIICKPVYSEGFCKKDIAIFHNPIQLLEEKAAYIEKCGEMSVSEFIPGDVTCNIEAHTFMADRPRIALMLRKLRSYNGNEAIAVSSVAESIWVPELVAPSLAFTKGIQFKGPIDINLKRSETNGNFYFLEANLRASALNSLGTAAGINMPAAIYHHLLGLDYSHLVSRKIEKGVRWVCENKLKGGLERVGEIEDIGAFAFGDDDDIMPLEQMIADNQFDFKFKRDSSAV